MAREEWRRYGKERGTRKRRNEKIKRKMERIRERKRIEKTTKEERKGGRLEVRKRRNYQRKHFSTFRVDNE